MMDHILHHLLHTVQGMSEYSWMWGVGYMHCGPSLAILHANEPTIMQRMCIPFLARPASGVAVQIFSGVCWQMQMLS